jgi:hypothetical protein
LFAVLPFAAVACASSAGGETSSSDLVERVDGSTLASPNVKPNATYLKQRKIASLEAVGAVGATQLSVAKRLDGIVASAPANGAYGVDELLRMEQPDFIATLRPEERAALPVLWELLETTNDAPAAGADPTLPSLEGRDVSTPAGPLVKPASIAIASVVASRRDALERLELTRNSDGDPSTVSEADLDGALAQPGPYTPAEVEVFKATKLTFFERATTALSAKVEVVPSGVTSRTVATFGAASIVVDDSVSYNESRTLDLGNTSIDTDYVSVDVSIRGLRRATYAVHGEQNVTLVLIDEASGEEIVSSGTLADHAASTFTVETWRSGRREGSYRTTLPAMAARSGSANLSTFVDYDFVTPEGKKLERNLTSAYEHIFKRGATWTYDAAPRPPSGNIAAADVLQPKLEIVPGRYELSADDGAIVTVDVYPQGVVRVDVGGVTASSALQLDIEFSPPSSFGYQEGPARRAFSSNVAPSWWGAFRDRDRQFSIEGAHRLSTWLNVAQRKG